MNAFRLVARGRVGPLNLAVEPEEVARAGRNVRDLAAVVAALVRCQGNVALVLAEQMDLDLRAVRGPDDEAAVVVPDRCRAEALLACQVALLFEKKTAPSGGTVTRIEVGRPPQGTGVVSTLPKLPCPLPPYSIASLLKISYQVPGSGTPRR